MENIAVFQTVAILACNAAIGIIMAVAQRKAADKDTLYMAHLTTLTSTLTSCVSSVGEIKNKINTLYEWHDKEDSNGMKIWYMPRSVSDMQKDIVQTQNTLVEVLRDLQRNHADFGKFMEKQSDTLSLIHMELVKNNKDREHDHKFLTEKLDTLKHDNNLRIAG